MKKLSEKFILRNSIKLLFFLIILNLIIYFSSPILEDLSGFKKLHIIGFSLFISAIVLGAYYFYNKAFYDIFEYELGEHELKITTGVINTYTIIIPYSKIRNVVVEIDLFSSIFKIGKIKIEIEEDLERKVIEIPGIEDYDDFVEFVVNKIEGIKTGNIELIENRLAEIENKIEEVKDLFKSLSPRFLVLEGELNHVNDKLERIENLHNSLDFDIKKVREITETTFFEVEFIKKELEKLKEEKTEKKTKTKKKTKKTKK